MRFVSVHLKRASPVVKAPEPVKRSYSDMICTFTVRGANETKPSGRSNNGVEIGDWYGVYIYI